MCAYHAFVEAPADDDDEGGVQEGGLDGGAEDVGEGEVHLGGVSRDVNGWFIGENCTWLS